MPRCPYATEVWIDGRRELLRCQRRRLLPLDHLHAAAVPYPVLTSANVRIRWRSSSSPDYHVDTPRGPAEVIE